MPDVVGVTNFPGTLDTHVTLMPVRDLESTTLDAPGVDADDTSFPCLDTSGWPATGYFTIEGEHVAYASKTLTSFDGCTRGRFTSLGGSAAAPHAAASTINLLVIAATHEVQNDALIATQTKLGAGASVPALDKFLLGTGAGTSAWGNLTDTHIATALGFTPAPGVTIQVGDATFVANATTFDFDPAWFTVTESPAGEGNLALLSGPVQDVGTLVISGGVITLPAIKANVGKIVATIDTEAAGALDDLDQINVTGSLPSPVTLVLKSLSGSRVTTVRHDPTKITLEAGRNFALASTSHRLTLERTGTAWVELARTPPAIGSVYQAWDPDLDALASTPTNYLIPPGSISLYAGAAAPTGWLLCDGSSLLRATYPALFAAIGTQFGAADGTHFTLPDLRDRFPIGKGVDVGNDVLGETGGVRTVTLSAAQSGLPSHAHAASSGNESTTHSHGYSDADTGEYAITNQVAGGAQPIYRNSRTVSSLSTGGQNVNHSHAITVSAVAAAGASAAHENMPPYIALNYIIKV